ncbi:MAG: hypothetical protein R6U86_09155 [Bacteroidales bacterium]
MGILELKQRPDGLMGVGLPLGIAVGLAVGSGMDKNAMEDGRQLNIELKNLMKETINYLQAKHQQTI